MKTIRIRRIAALCIPALVSLSLAATAQTDPPDDPVSRDRWQAERERKQRREDARHYLREVKQAREDAKQRREKRREDAKQRREERREDAKERREDRLERRKARIKELREKWGDVARKPLARAEIKVHVHRMARLRRIREVAESKGKTAIVARVDRLIEREKNRHQRAMDRIKAQGG